MNFFYDLTCDIGPKRHKIKLFKLQHHFLLESNSQKLAIFKETICILLLVGDISGNTILLDTGNIPHVPNCNRGNFQENWYSLDPWMHHLKFNMRHGHLQI